MAESPALHSDPPLAAARYKLCHGGGQAGLLGLGSWSITPPLPWLAPRNSYKVTAQQSGLIKFAPYSEDSKSSMTLPNTVQSSQLKSPRNAGTVSGTAEFHTLTFQVHLDAHS